MEIRIPRDAAAAVVIAVFGAATALYSYVHYPVGTVTRMGAGMFPTVLGCLLVVLSVPILVKAAVVRGQSFTLDLRAAFFVLLSLSLFGLMVRPFGIVPAIIVLVAVSTGAVAPFSFKRAAALSVTIAIGVVVIFNVFMRLRLDLFAWPL